MKYAKSSLGLVFGYLYVSSVARFGRLDAPRTVTLEGVYRF
jgi:hypothetical protein